MQNSKLQPKKEAVQFLEMGSPTLGIIRGPVAEMSQLSQSPAINKLNRSDGLRVFHRARGPTHSIISRVVHVSARAHFGGCAMCSLFVLSAVYFYTSHTWLKAFLLSGCLKGQAASAVAPESGL